MTRDEYSLPVSRTIALSNLLNRSGPHLSVLELGWLPRCPTPTALQHDDVL
jgi:hypothetical protein